MRHGLSTPAGDPGADAEARWESYFEAHHAAQWAEASPERRAALLVCELGRDRANQIIHAMLFDTWERAVRERVTK
jgi:hypothetical protein